MSGNLIRQGGIYHNGKGRDREIMLIEQNVIYYRKDGKGEWYSLGKEQFCKWAKGEIK